MPVCGNYLFFELPKKIVLNPKDGTPQGVSFAEFFCGKNAKMSQKPSRRKALQSKEASRKALQSYGKTLLNVFKCGIVEYTTFAYCDEMTY